jgi:mono/diheme cytochrome c family protein
MKILWIAALSFSAVGAQAADAEDGKALFARHCAACHGERGFATTRLEKKVGKEQAMLERRTDLNPALIKHVVRHGIGSMPWFTRVELSDADATAIGVYLTRNSK